MIILKQTSIKSPIDISIGLDSPVTFSLVVQGMNFGNPTNYPIPPGLIDTDKKIGLVFEICRSSLDRIKALSPFFIKQTRVLNKSDLCVREHHSLILLDAQKNSKENGI